MGVLVHDDEENVRESQFFPLCFSAAMSRMFLTTFSISSLCGSAHTSFSSPRLSKARSGRKAQRIFHSPLKRQCGIGNYGNLAVWDSGLEVPENLIEVCVQEGFTGRHIEGLRLTEIAMITSNTCKQQVCLLMDRRSAGHAWVARTHDASQSALSVADIDINSGTIVKCPSRPSAIAALMISAARSNTDSPNFISILAATLLLACF